MRVCFDQGIHLPELELWLDPQTRRPRAFVSHAHSDHIGSHDEVLATVPTAAMMRLRGRRAPAFRTLSYGEKYPVHGGQVSLFPAGHILGSAQLLAEQGGCRILYSGDFKLRPGRSCEAADVPAADVVVMETTFGLPRYRFPPTETVAAEIAAFCRAALSEGRTTVLFCYALGKGQELLAWLGEFENVLWLHPSHAEMAALYRAFGVSLPRYSIYTPGARLEAAVLLAPPGARSARWLERLPRRRTAYVSGWGLDSGAPFRFGVEACFPLSDHADYDDLLDYVRRTGARSIYTVHGFAAEFARDLRARGYDARPLAGVPSASPAQLAFEW